MLLAIFLILLMLAIIFGGMMYGFTYFLEWYKRREDARKERGRRG